MRVLSVSGCVAGPILDVTDDFRTSAPLFRGWFSRDVIVLAGLVAFAPVAARDVPLCGERPPQLLGGHTGRERRLARTEPPTLTDRHAHAPGPRRLGPRELCRLRPRRQAPHRAGAHAGSINGRAARCWLSRSDQSLEGPQGGVSLNGLPVHRLLRRGCVAPRTDATTSRRHRVGHRRHDRDQPVHFHGGHTQSCLARESLIFGSL
jgi:hypothetical protein